MALKGLKREDQTSKNEKLAHDFISGASKNIQELTPSNAKFQRYTFSLTEDVSEQINDLKVKCRVAKANRSIILKAAVSELNTLSDEDLHNLIKKELGY